MDAVYRKYLRDKAKKKAKSAEQKKRSKTKVQKKSKAENVKSAETFWTRYAAYLKTDEWAKKRAQAFRIWGDKCQLCECTESLHVHHRTYENVFKEKMDDLMIVCHPCHEKIHGRMFKRIGR